MPDSTYGIETINGAIENLLKNRLHVQPLVIEAFLPELQQLAAHVNRLQQVFQQLSDFTNSLSSGNLEAAMPDRRNYLAAGLKQLHSQLLHLTWQTQCVADGDYQQVIDFMGDFAHAFNAMVVQLREREEDISAQRDVMMSVFDNIEPLFIVDQNNMYNALYYNHKASARFRINGDDLSKAVEHTQFLKKVLDVGVGKKKELYDNDTDHWYSVATSKMPWIGGKISVLYYCMDITVHKLRESDLHHAANTDQLTGLFNRRAFDETFDATWNKCKLSGESLSLLMIDIDHFKKCNDQYGHIHGDKVLASLAKCLSLITARPGDMVARYGGEEFVVLLPSTDKHGSIVLAESMRTAVKSLDIIYDENPSISTHITISIGVSTCIPTDSNYPINLIQLADEALYSAKLSGRDRVVHI